MNASDIDRRFRKLQLWRQLLGATLFPARSLKTEEDRLAAAEVEGAVFEFVGAQLQALMGGEPVGFLSAEEVERVRGLLRDGASGEFQPQEVNALRALASRVLTGNDQPMPVRNRKIRPRPVAQPLAPVRQEDDGDDFVDEENSPEVGEVPSTMIPPQSPEEAAVIGEVQAHRSTRMFSLHAAPSRST